MTNINGKEISKSVNGWVVDGMTAYLARDGVTLITGTGKALMVLTEAQVATFRAEDDTARAAQHARPAPTTSRVSKERAHDLAFNEGGEGYNPHRHGAAKTYR